MSGWQSVATAPKDGKVFFGCWLGRVELVVWNDTVQNWQSYPDGDFDNGGELTHWLAPCQ